MQLSAWDVASIGIKAILYAATLSAAGGVFFLIYNAALLGVEHSRRIRRWVGLCTIAGLVASVLRLSILAGSLGERAAALVDGEMWRMILQAGEARAMGIRVAGLFLIATMAVSARSSLPALMGAVLSATSFAWIGHAWSAGGVSTTLLSLHLIGVAFWLGALVPLLSMVRAGDLPHLAAAAARFGHWALVVVCVLLATGATLLSFLLGSLAELWTSPYGRAVSMKLALVACLLSVGAFNKLRLTPRLQANDSRAGMSFRRSLQLEMLLGGLILIVTAIFTTLIGPPALE